ncbi:MAG: histidinol-phosphate transaminase [Actinomycetes bacterium]
MGLLDRYRRFSELTDSEVKEGFRARAEDRRARELERVETLDLTETTGEEMPAGEVVAAISFAAKRALNLAPDPLSTELRDQLADLSDAPRRQVGVGNGATALIGAIAAATLKPGDELVTPWPSYPLYPIAAAAAGADAIPVEHSTDPAELAESVNGRPMSRILMVCNPNDPDGNLLSADYLAALREELNDQTLLVVDEALVDYAGRDHMDATARLVSQTSGIVLIRSLSKAWGLSSLRVGWLITGEDGEPLITRLAPLLGVPAPSEAGALAALENTGKHVDRRVTAVRRERARVEQQLAGSAVEFSTSSANFIWARLPGVKSLTLSERMRAAGVKVTDGSAVGADEHIRATISGSEAATDRLIEALRDASSA